MCDRGPGVSAKALTHAFDAFFSDKPAGRSRGLGLTRAKSCVEAIGGRIVLSNAPGGGALAKIWRSRLGVLTVERGFGGRWRG